MRTDFENMTFNELDESFNHLDQYTLEECKELYRNIKRFLPKNIISLNEMALNRREFYSMCIRFYEQIHYNIINIIILGEYSPENINHWKSELLGYVKRIFNQSTEKSVKKTEIVKEIIIDVWCDQTTFEYDTDEPIINAIKDEIRKGEKNILINKYILNVMKNNILPYTEDLMYIHNKDFKIIFRSLYNTFKQKDFNIFRNTIERYCTD